jgi:hypothetical protein
VPAAIADLRPSTRHVWITAGVAILVSGVLLAAIPAIGALPSSLQLDLGGLDRVLAQAAFAFLGCVAGVVALAAASSGLFRRRRVPDAVLGALALFAALGVGILALIIGFFGIGFGADTVWVDLGTSPGGRHLVVRTLGWTHPFADLGELDGVVVRPIGSASLPDGAAPISGHVRVTDDGGAVVLRWDGDGGGATFAG